MFCMYCGKDIPDDSFVCAYCGAKITPETGQPPSYTPMQNANYQPHQQFYGTPPPIMPKKNNNLALIAMICGIAGLLCCGIAGVAGLIMGIIAKKKIAETGEGGSGMAATGIVLGLISIIVWVIALIMYVAEYY